MLRTTALQSLVVLAFATPAIAQPAPSARPAGGVVIGGAASIGQTAATTTVTQSTQRAAIDWRSFDVGSGHTVQFQQPGTTAVVLNRVTGPDPSQIAGTIRANGQVVITNQSGVVFHQGAQVDAAGLVVSAAGISTPNFMAGRMVFDQAPKPNAQVSNAGTITIRQAGLAALVAPRVANSGVIHAQMGRVVLAGAEAHTVDLYGDGLLSLDITKQVHQAPRGADGKVVTSLVTNTGTIIADGGSVQLTAAAADGIVQTLVQSGGRLQANAAGGRPGTVVLNGVGGSVRIVGAVVADGGGTVVAAGTGAVTVGASARIKANGAEAAAGGGTILIGTRSGSGTTIEAGAKLSANGRGGGSGGRVTMLSGGTTKFGGSVSVRGGERGGSGGAVELSGHTVGMTGTVDASAPNGRNGTFLLDPTDVTISDHGGSGTVVTPASLQATRGDVTVQADNSITASSSVFITGEGRSLTLNAGNVVRVDAGVTLSTEGGNLDIIAGAGGINVLGNLTTALNLSLSATGTITQGAASRFTSTSFGTTSLSSRVSVDLQGAISSNAVSFSVAGAVTQGAGGAIATGDVSGNVGSLALTSRANQISGLGSSYTGPLTATTGDAAVVTSNALQVGYFSGYNSGGVIVPDGHAISLTADTLNILAATNVLSAPNGTVALQPFTAGRQLQLVANQAEQVTTSLSLTQADVNAITTGTLRLGSTTGAAVTLGNAGDAITLTGHATTLDVRSAGAVSQAATATLTVPTLTGTAASIALPGANRIGALGAVTTTGTLSINDAAALTVNGPVIAGGVATLSTTGAAGLTLAGDVNAPSLTSTTGTGAITQAAGTVTVTGIATFNSGGGISQTGGAIVSPSLTGRAGGLARFGSTTNRIDALGDFTSVNGFALNDASSLAVSGTVRDPNSVILTTPGSVTIPGTISTGALVLAVTGSVGESGAGTVIARDVSGSVGSLALTSRTNQITGLGSSFRGSLSASTGDVAVVTSGILQAGYTSNGVVVPDGHAISLTADTMTLSGNAGALRAPNGTVALQPFTAGRRLQLVTNTGEQDATMLSLTQAELNAITTGTLRLGSTTGAAVTLGNAGDTISLAGHATTLDVLSAAAVSQDPTATLTVPTLTGTVGGFALPGANGIGALGAITTTGVLSVNDAVALRVAGPISVGTSAALSTTGAAGITLAGDMSAASLTVAAGTGGIVQTTGAITVPGPATFTSGGDVTQSGGTMTLGSLGGSSGGALSLTSPGDVIPIVNGYTAGTGFDLATLGDLVTTGSLTGGVSVRLSPTGDLSLSRTLSAPTVTLSARSITQPGGQVTAGLLNVSASDATLTGAVDALGTVQVPGTFRLVDTAGALATYGAIGVGTLDLTAATVTFGPATIGTLRLATGSVDQSGGSLQVGTLTGSSTGSVALGTGRGTASIGTLSDFSAGGAFALTDSTGLTVAGTIATPTLALRAPGSLTLQGGTIAADAATIEVTGPGGALTQTGTTVLTPFTEVGQFQLTVAGGAITVADLSGARVGLTLTMGGGSATGALDVASLRVDDQGGSATLTGSVAGQTAFGAAMASTISRFDPAYTLNGCAIASITCGPSVVPPPAPPQEPVQPPTPIVAPDPMVVPTPVPTPAPTPTPIAMPEPLPAPAPTPPRVNIEPPSTIRPDIVLVQSLLRPNLFIADLITLDIVRGPPDPEFVLPNISDRDY